ncbi:2'-5' RNA ligase family protein [Nocardia sp. BMG51109]|uniref:2'-5' RNA ligase family protein n=1 Tax=Nocardia sp. BMG51109 TaxID=1056816 RepID=UPI0004BCFD07|nr:2'-5' RNA ligase family protein [Nocardia sp. BMG51109]
MEDHWTLKPWPTGYAAYYWYLTFDDPSLIALAEHCQRRLDHLRLDPVPRDGFHATVLKVAAADAVGADDLEVLVAAAQARLADFESFSLQVGPLTGSPSAVRFSLAPWDRLSVLHARLRQSVIDVRPSLRPRSTSEFRPHLGIAYNNRRRPAGPVVADVARLRDVDPVTEFVRSVALVRLERVDHQYRWDECAVIALQS